MYNCASTIKSKHEYKILPRNKPKVLQHKTELSRYVLWNFAVTEKTICCRELHNLPTLYPYIVSEHEIEWQKVRQKLGKIFAEPNLTEPAKISRTPNRTEISVASYTKCHRGNPRATTSVSIIIEVYGFIDRCNFLILSSGLTISVQKYPT